MTTAAQVITTLAASTVLAVCSAKADTFRARSGATYTVDSKLGSLLLRDYQAERRHDYARAISFYTAALKASPQARTAAAIYDFRGLAHVENKDLGHALQDANEVVRLEPTYFGAYQIRGLVYSRKGEYDRAIDQYNKALTLKADFAQLHVNRGVANSDKGEEQRAISDYNEAIRRDPKLSDAYVDRGNSYDTLKQFGKALADYSEAIRLDPADRRGAGAAYTNRALSFQKIREFGRALADLQTAVRLAPSNPENLNGVAWLRATCNDDSIRNGREAVQEALKACRMTGWANASYLDTLAAAYAEAGEFEEAVEYERRALESGSDAKDLRQFHHRLSLYQTHGPFRERPRKG